MIRFQKTNYYANEDAYEHITDTFASLKESGYIDDLTETDDIYLYEGNFIAVQEYEVDSWQEEGHGMHTLTSAVPLVRNSVLICTEESVKQKLHKIEYPDAYLPNYN